VNHPVKPHTIFAFHMQSATSPVRQGQNRWCLSHVLQKIAVNRITV